MRKSFILNPAQLTTKEGAHSFVRAWSNGDLISNFGSARQCGKGELTKDEEFLLHLFI